MHVDRDNIKVERGRRSGRMPLISGCCCERIKGGLTDREAIADALYRVVLAFDHADEALLRSSMTEHVKAEIPGVVAANNIEEVKAKVFGGVSKLDTTHFLSNVRQTDG